MTIAAVLPAPARPAAAQQPPGLFLFRPVDADTAGATSACRGDACIAPTAVLTTRARLVLVDWAQLGDLDPKSAAPLPDILQLNLFDDTLLTAICTGGACYRGEACPASRVWTGRVEGVPASAVVLLVQDGQLAGDIWMPNAIYQIRPAAGADGEPPLHVIRQIDPDAFPDDTRDAIPAPEGESVPQIGVVGAQHAAPLPHLSQSPVIDLLVAYTPRARDEAGGTAAIELEIAANVAIANASYANSGVLARLRLVQSVQVAYAESGSLVTDLYRLSERGDGVLEEIHSQRDAAGADLVALLVSSPNGMPGGVAWLLGDLDAPWAEALGYSVMAIQGMASFLVFPHEIGHNLGADHDWYADENPSHQLYPYSHGQVSLDGGWCTIMAYRSLCGQAGVACARIPYWSNPEISYAGRPTGVPPGTNTACATRNPANPPCDADNRRTLNNTAPTIANYRSPSPTLALGLVSEPERIQATTTRIAYVLTIEDRGDLPVTGLRLTDTLPVEMSYVPASGSPPPAVETPRRGVVGGQVAWAGLACDAHEVLRLTFYAEANRPLHQGNALVHTVQVTSDQGILLPPTEFRAFVDPHLVFLPVVQQ